MFENFRKVCKGRYGLDPAHYYTAPGLSCDSLLKKTGVELELLTDLDMHLCIEKRVDVKIVRSWETDKIRRLVASPSYARHEIFGKDLAGMHMHKTRLLLDKPI